MKKNMIIYGCYEGVQVQAIRHLTEILLDATMEYPVCVSCDKYVEDEGFRHFFIGTKENNPYVKALSDKELTHKEEYYIKVSGDTVLIEGKDDAGVLYGCIDFYNKFILKQNHAHKGGCFRNWFEEEWGELEESSFSSLERRGLWTWGYVIYDYKGYIDNMARLKMNTLIIWNDFVPVNAREMVEYAHDSNVKVYWGYPWGWDTSCNKVDVKNIHQITDWIIQHYEEHYAHLGSDGIYFQSFTETKKDTIDGVLIAQAVTEFVNDAAGKLLAKYPDLELQFGLHASSVKNQLKHMKQVDPRLVIVWEDCGSCPYDYCPENLDGFEETREFTKKILKLRGEHEKFGTVLKGFTKLDWSSFEHQKGSYYHGVASPKMLNNRRERKSRIWHYVQAYWLRNADKAYEIIRLMQSESDGKAMVTALVEDSMFENKIYYPVAMYAAMLWDCHMELKDLMCDVALSEWVEFA